MANADQLAKRFPLHTIVQSYWLPAQIAIDQKHALWKDADSDIPVLILKQAKVEYAKLQ